MNTGEITIEDIVWAIRKLKRNKAAGPDGVPMEFFKEMTYENLERIRTIINAWWAGTPVPDSVTQAQVILLYKKGDKTDLSNYRPISLLNSIYKVYTAIIQQRIADALDHHLQPTQYGFRRKKGTADALHHVRRVMEKGESTLTKTLFVLLG